MGTGYSRNDTSNNIADGNIINASDLDGEFDAVQAAFNASTGHTHDGTTAEGAPITVTGPVQDYVSSATEFRPKTNNTYDLGSLSLQWKDLYVDGTGYIDSVDIDGGAIDGTVIGGTTPAAISGTTGQFSTSLNVDGTVTADGLTVDGGVNIDTAVPILRLDSPATAWAGGEDLGGLDWYTKDTSGSGPAVMARIYSESSGANTLPIPNMIFQTSVADVSLKDRLKIAGTGDISFYEDTGTTAKFFWDASAEALGIGTSSPVDSLEVAGNVASAHRIRVNNANASGSETLAFTQGSTFKSWIEFDNSTSNFDVWQYTNNALRFGTNNTERMRIDSSGNVGIGTSSPSNYFSGATDLVISGSGDSGLTIASGTSGAGRIHFADGTSGDAEYRGYIVYAHASDSLQIATSGTEAMRIDSSGNLLVGTTTNSSSVAGVTAGNGGLITAARSSNYSGIFNRLSTDGDIVQFRKDGTTVGSIGVSGSYVTLDSGTGYNVVLYREGAPRYVVGNNTFFPHHDNLRNLGALSNRWDDVYATNGTIQTSDRNEKQDIAELEEAERRVAVAAKGLLRKFRWKDAVAEKGDDARIHFGIIAQDLQAAFAAEGLDAGKYAMFIHSTWTDEETGEERSRMGVRYSELLAFIIAAL